MIAKHHIKVNGRWYEAGENVPEQKSAEAKKPEPKKPETVTTGQMSFADVAENAQTETTVYVPSATEVAESAVGEAKAETRTRATGRRKNSK